MAYIALFCVKFHVKDLRYAAAYANGSDSMKRDCVFICAFYIDFTRC